MLSFCLLDLYGADSYTKLLLIVWHSNDNNSLKSFFLKKLYITVIETAK